MKNRLLVSIAGVAILGVFIYYTFSPNITKIYNQESKTEEQSPGTTAVPTW